ncbi:hypothetical protein CB0940_12012 [Cercospora beticola]|uniref:Uncharacterized protein n=1 Tax=Cercospora beticola TaxID=122368 RepID=A0A2G5IFA0_CERBT|nr:hypothetical protein CB0940_12012 [Cercospora beticola]PIB03143.1 hypothetical protein CB0940_12012 [Cercospora beticola]WPB04395.1 hypothetical protein RHO25_009041 [Cercospora beticola]CAK1356777.1 unnamed protein product [Cercospora beticola]
MSTSKQTLAILQQVIDEFGPRLNIHGGSKVLVSDSSIAQALYELTEPVRTPFGPTLTVASQEQPDQSQVSQIPNATVLAADKLAMDHYTHAVFGVSGEDPKYIFGGIKHTIYALQPKGYAVVIALKQETKQVSAGEGEGEFQVSLDDKMKYQSKGRINNLEDALYYAGFERGRVKKLEDKKAVVDGQDVEAQVFLAMKWDQLTA